MTRPSTAVGSLDAPLRLVVEDRCAPSILERVIREAEPYLERATACIADDFPAAAPDMVQEARITLWQLDLGRFAQHDAPYLKRILYYRIIDVYKTECLGGLTTGWSRHIDRGTRTRGARDRMPKAA